MPFSLDKPVEKERRDEVGHQHDAEHTDDGDGSQREHGRVLGHDKGAYANEHDQGGEYDALLVGSQKRLAVGELVTAPFGDEDGVVVALSEDECGEDDVYDIELHAAQTHHAENP